jgi:hypothetical protein
MTVLLKCKINKKQLYVLMEGKLELELPKSDFVLLEKGTKGKAF